jgi:hypothetical protein
MHTLFNRYVVSSAPSFRTKQSSKQVSKTALLKCCEPRVRCATQGPNNLSIGNQSWFRSKMIWSTTSSFPCLDQVLWALDQRIVPQRLLRLHANSINMVLFPFEGGPRSGPRTLKSWCLIGCLYALGISLLVSVSGQCKMKIQLLLLLIFGAAPPQLEWWRCAILVHTPAFLNTVAVSADFTPQWGYWPRAAVCKS